MGHFCGKFEIFYKCFALICRTSNDMMLLSLVRYVWKCHPSGDDFFFGGGGGGGGQPAVI